MPTINKTVGPEFGSTSQTTQPFTYATNDFQKAGATKKKKNTAQKNKKNTAQKNKKNTAQTNKKNKRQENKFLI